MRRGLIATHVALLMLANICIGVSEGFFFPDGGNVLGAPAVLWSSAATTVLGAAVFFHLSLKAGEGRLRHAAEAALLYFALAFLLSVLFLTLLGPLPIEGLVIYAALDLFGFSVGTFLGGVVARRRIAASSDA